MRGPSDDREEVHQPRGGETARDLGHVGGGEPAGRHLVARDPRPQHPVTSDLAPDLAQDLEAETHTVLEAPAVVVGSLVEQWRPELVHEVVVGERELHAVQAALAAAAGRVPERAHHHGDLLGLDLVRHLAMHLLRDLRGRQQHVHLLHVGLGAPAHVGELAHDPAIMAMHGVRDAAIARDHRIVVIGDHVPRAGRGRRMHAGGPADDGQRRAAAGLGLVIGPEARAGLALLGHRLGVAAREDAVLQREPTHSQRREQVTILGGHSGHSMDARGLPRQRPSLSFLLASLPAYPFPGAAVRPWPRELRMPDGLVRTMWVAIATLPVGPPERVEHWRSKAHARRP